jgi:hypothetical protein
MSYAFTREVSLSRALPLAEYSYAFRSFAHFAALHA